MKLRSIIPGRNNIPLTIVKKRALKLVITLFFITVGTVKAQGQDPPDRPNIVFVIADSHRSDALGANGNPIARTPNLDSLAYSGLNFKQAYVTTAICAVSRASILSGQYQLRHRINDFVTDFSGEAWSNTYPMLLKKAGYTVAQIGFLGVGKNPPATTFDHWEDKIPWMGEDSVHQTDAITQKATGFIARQQNSQKPFYLAVSYHAAHEIDPRDGKPAHYLIQSRFRELYKDRTIPVPVSASGEHWDQFPAFFKTDKNIARQRWHGFFSTDSLLQENTKNYYRLVTGLDEAVGKIVESIRKHAPNTIFIYTSDHGFSLGEHGLMGKWYGFQTAIHVPLIINDLRENRRLPITSSEDFALNIDLAPTILGLAGISAPEAMQGIDLVGNLKKRTAQRPYFFYEHTVFPSPLLPKIEGIVGKDYKYLVFTEHNYELLYDLKKDQQEVINLSGDRSYRKILGKYRNLYRKHRESLH